jgi:hypothetical protein
MVNERGTHAHSELQSVIRPCSALNQNNWALDFTPRERTRPLCLLTLHDTGVFRWYLEQGADLLLTVKSNQKTLYRQIGRQLEKNRKIPFTATDVEKRHGRQTRWELKAKVAPEHIKANWPGSALIVEVMTSTTTRNGKREIACHRHGLRPTSPTSPACAPPQKPCGEWSVSDGALGEWHWVRDTQLGEDTHPCSNRTGVAVFSFLRTVVMNLLRRGGYRSIRQGFRELAYDIKRMLALGGVTTHQGMP